MNLHCSVIINYTESTTFGAEGLPSLNECQVQILPLTSLQNDEEIQPWLRNSAIFQMNRNFSIRIEWERFVSRVSSLFQTRLVVRITTTFRHVFPRR